MTVQRDINKIEFSGREWALKQPVKNIKPNIAIDSETVDGKPFLMASSNLKGNNHIFSDNIDDFLHFLTNKRFRASNNWWYNLDYDVGGIIKMLPRDNVIELINNGFTQYNEFKLTYIIGKVFKISKRGNTSIHYDLAQFYNKQPLKSLASKTRYDKVEVDDIADIDLKRIDNDPEYKNHILNRCIIDARITEDLSNQFVAFAVSVVRNNRYFSVASLPRAYFLTNLTTRLKLPTPRIMDYGLKTFHGGLIDTLKLGTFKNVVNIDIASAYPSVMANLYSCNGVWTSEPTYIPDTAYSFYKVNVDFFDDDISPLWFNHKHKDYHPNGMLETFITQFEYEFFMEKGFDIEILNAVHLLKSKDHDQPFKNLINDLYQKRVDAIADGDGRQLIYKLILNSAYGCTINDVEKIIPCSLNEWEEDGENPYHSYLIDGQDVFYLVHNIATSMYNPVFASYITSGTRMNVINTLWNHRDKVISINTDGAYLSSNIHIKTGHNLGDWTSQKYRELKVMGNGRYFIYDHDGTLNVKKSAFRGLRSAKKNMPGIDKQMIDNPNRLGVSFKCEKPFKVKECVRSDNIDQINIWHPHTSNMSFILDRRVWDHEIKFNIDLLDNQIGSRPFNINEIKASC